MPKMDLYAQLTPPIININLFVTALHDTNVDDCENQVNLENLNLNAVPCGKCTIH